MQHIDALKRLTSIFRRQSAVEATDLLSGPTLLDQEPDLAQETARYNLRASSWAAGGHPTD